MAIQRTQVTATGATGGSGTATATAVTDVVVEGYPLAVHLAYLGSPPSGSTDVTLTEAANAPAMPILAVSNAATDGWFPVLAQAKNQAGADITGMGTRIAVADYVRVTIAQANDNDGVTATLVWDDGK